MTILMFINPRLWFSDNILGCVVVHHLFGFLGYDAHLSPTYHHYFIILTTQPKLLNSAASISQEVYHLIECIQGGQGGGEGILKMIEQILTNFEGKRERKTNKGILNSYLGDYFVYLSIQLSQFSTLLALQHYSIWLDIRFSLTNMFVILVQFHYQ